MTSIYGLNTQYLISPYKFEHIKGKTFQQSGADGYEIHEHRDYGLKPMGSSTMTIHADSMLTIYNFKYGHRDTTSYTMEFMNLYYYTPRVVWDSIRVVNYGDHGKTEKMIIKDNLTTEKHHAITHNSRDMIEEAIYLQRKAICRSPIYSPRTST